MVSRKRHLGQAVFASPLSPVALGRGRVIGTDCRQLLALHVANDDQEHEQGSSKNDPLIDLHRSNPCFATI
jgi:hypothetical protein